jgi:alginate O-acetyltransferase complex protein AlgI
MLFNSLPFIFGFLPIAWLIFQAIGRTGRRSWLLGWLFAASLFFYGWWEPKYLLLLLGSICFNYALGLALRRGLGNPRAILVVGIGADLLVLFYFKYKHFALNTVNAFFDTGLHWEALVLPLGISFFTFQQIAYRLQVYQGERSNDTFLEYATCVVFFPHLIAGPIVNYSEIMPQLRRPGWGVIRWKNLSVGLTIFVAGLAKKLFADHIAQVSSPIFDLAASGVDLTFWEAWAAALGYTLQLYLDFSGYCDMAIGLAWLFDVRLPMNFNSPYRATSIVDFWRRWHMTLSRFLRFYLYLPLRRLRSKNSLSWKYVCLLLTMLLGGLWHGAGWTFVVWGGIHGLLLVINHVFRDRFPDTAARLSATRWWTPVAWGLTFTSVVCAWVFFRAKNLASATFLLERMAGLRGIYPDVLHGNAGLHATDLVFMLAVTAALIALPNIYQVFDKESPITELPKQLEPVRPAFRWRPAPVIGIAFGGIFFFFLQHFFAATPSEFLYFNF